MQPLPRRWLNLIFGVAFEANYHETEYPVYGIGSFFVFGNKQVSTA